MANTINNLAHFYKGVYTDEDYTKYSVEEKSEALQDSLMSVCDHIALVNRITDDKKIDVEYLLNVVGSYLMGIQEGQLDINTTEPPSKLFETSLYPALDKIDGEVVKEVDSDESDDSKTPRGDVT